MTVNKYAKNIFVIITFMLFGFVGVNGSFAKENIKRTGTFSTLHYNEEGGDLLGEELRIVYTKRGHQGTLQFSEGSPEEMVFIKPVFDGNKIKFPIDSRIFKGEFEGKISIKGIAGVFKSQRGVKTKVFLPRKKGYWD